MYDPNVDINKILELAKENNIEALQDFLDTGICIDVENQASETAISKAAQENNFKAVTVLLSLGAHINWAIKGAALGGAITLLNKLLENPQANIRWSLLGAAMGGQSILVDQLLAKTDADVNWAVHGAAINGHKELLATLLSKPGAHIGWAIAGSAQGGHMKLLKKYLSKKPGVNINWAVKGAAKGNHPRLLNKMLAKKGANINEAIYNAAISANSGLLYRLLSSPYADVNWALHGAAKGGHGKLVKKLLLQTGVNINWNIRGAQTELLSTLLSNPNLYNTICTTGSDQHHQALIKVLTKPIVNINWAVSGAARGGHLNLLDKLLAHPRADINWALKGAAKSARKILVDNILVQSHSNINIAVKHASYITARHLVLKHMILLDDSISQERKIRFLEKRFNDNKKFSKLLVDLRDSGKYAEHLNIFYTISNLIPSKVNIGKCIDLADRIYHLQHTCDNVDFKQLYQIATAIADGNIEGFLSFNSENISQEHHNIFNDSPDVIKQEIVNFLVQGGANNSSYAKLVLQPLFSRERKATGILKEAIHNFLNKQQPSHAAYNKCLGSRQCAIL